MESVFNGLIRLFMIIGIVISWNVEANPINQWVTHDQLLFQLQKVESNKEFSGKFLHITDIHLDPFYLPDTSPSKLCHRFDQNSKKDKSKKFGTPDSECDTPYTLTNSTFLFLKENFQDVDFIIYTGDSLMHDRDPKLPLTEEYVKWGHETIVKYITDTFDLDRTKFIPTLGNNDEWDHNQLGRGPNSLFGNLTQIWAPLNLNLTSDFLNGGYFRQDINSKLSVISINSMYFYNSNDQIKDCHHANSPGAIQLSWIQNQLENAIDEGRKVYIATHIPPLDSDGEASFYPTCQTKYVKMLGNFSDVIAGHFTGHTNLDTLTFVTESKNIDGKYSLVYLDKDDGPSAVSHQDIILVLNNAPSIYPVHNSGFREYKYSTSPETFGMLTDYVQYYTDIKEANKRGRAEWKIEYTASETYRMKRLLPSDWAEVLEKMNKDDKMWKSYFKYVTVSADY